MKVIFFICLGLVALASATPAAPQCPGSPAIPFGVDGQSPVDWKYYQTATFNAIDLLAPGWELPAFNDGPWSSGPTPFGQNIFCAEMSPWIAHPGQGVNGKTVWDRGTDLYLRKSFSLDAPLTVSLDIVVDNDLIELFVNGHSVVANPVVRDGCGGVSSIIHYNIPASVTVAGNNLVAVHVRDHGDLGTGNQAFVNLQISPVGTYGTDGQGEATSPTNCVCLQ